jgi:hypothetical protein
MVEKRLLLKVFGYRSSLDIKKVMITKDTYMPTIENFDLKFDSSARIILEGFGHLL